MGEPHPIDAGARPKLGELLVQRGLLTQEQLGAALAEQQASGLPLGAILVRDGLVPSHKVAILLAEQSGGPLKTEFGYAVGAAPAEPAVADVLSLRPPMTPAPVEPPVSEPPLDGLRLAGPEPPAEPAPALEPVQPLPALATVAPDEVQAPPARDTALEALEARLEAEIAARTALEAKLADVEAGVEAALAGRAALEQEVQDLRARADAAEANALQAADLQVALSDRLAALELQADELTAARASEERPLAGRPYTSERHILLAPLADRYELVERPGPAPGAGSRIELFDNRSFVVVRVGPAPIPGALEACAYLEPIPTRFPPPGADTEAT